MKIALMSVSMLVGAHVAWADCSEDEFTAPPYCFSPAQARYACENSGASQVGLDQVRGCLDSWIAQNGRLEPLDRANCIGEDVISDVDSENVTRCR